MQPQQNNNKQSRSSSRNTSSSSTRGFSTSRSRSSNSATSSTTRVFSNPPPVVFQQQGVSSSNTSSSTPVVSQQQTFHPISIDLTRTSITQLPKHLTKMLSKKPSKTKLSPVMERNSNPDSLKRNSNSGGVSDVSESLPDEFFANIMSQPEDLDIPADLRTPPRTISPEHISADFQLDMVHISSDLQDHDGFGNEHLDTYLPNYFHDMPTTLEPPEAIPPLPLTQERNSNPSDLKRNSNSGGNTKIHCTTNKTMTKTSKFTTTSILACLKSIHDAYLYSSKGISVTVEEQHIASILGPGTLDEQRRKIRDYIQTCSDTKYKQLEKTFQKNYHMDLVAYGDQIKSLVKKVKPARHGTPPAAPRFSPVEPLSSQEEIIEVTPPPKPKPVTLSLAVQAKILINKCRQSARLEPLDVPEDCTLTQLTEAVRTAAFDLDQKLDTLEADLADYQLQQQEEQNPDLLEEKAEIQPTPDGSVSPDEIFDFGEPIPPVNFLPRTVAEVEAVEVLEPLVPLEPEVEEFNVAYAEYAGICEDMGLEPKERCEFSDFKEIDAEIERLETPPAPLPIKAAAEPKPQTKDPTPEPDVDAVKLPETSEDEQDDEDPISSDRHTQVVQMFAKYSHMPTDIFLLIIEYLLSMEFYSEAAAVVKSHFNLLESEIPYALKQLAVVFLNYQNFYNQNALPNLHPNHRISDESYQLLVMMRENIYRMQDRRYRYAMSHRPLIEYLIGRPPRVKELKSILCADRSQLKLANQMCIESLPAEYNDYDVTLWKHKTQRITALHELESPDVEPETEELKAFQTQLQNSKAVQRRNERKQKHTKKLATLHAAAEPIDPKRDPRPDPDGITGINLMLVGGSSKGFTGRIDELGLQPRGNQRPDFSFTPTPSIFSRAQLREYSRRDQRPINTRAVRYRSAEGVEIEEPVTEPTRFPKPQSSRPRKSVRPRADVYQQRAQAALQAPPAPRIGPLVPEVQFAPEPYIQSRNKRAQKARQKYEEAAEFDEDGQVIMIEEKKRGRPNKPKHLHKYQKKYNKRGRPKKSAKPEVSPPWTPEVLPLHLWDTPSRILNPQVPVARDAFPPHDEKKQDTFNDEIEEHYMEPPTRPPKYNWEDRRHWERKRIVRDYENDFRRRFVSTGLQPVSEEPQVMRGMIPPPAPVLKPPEPFIAREKEIPLIPPAPVLRPIEPPGRKRGRPRKERPPKPPSRRQIQQQEREEVQRQIDEEHERGIAESEELLQFARHLGVPYLSNQIKKITKRVFEIQPGVLFRDTGFIFNYNQGSLDMLAIFGAEQMFDNQLRYVAPLVERTLNRQIARWRVILHYTSPNGDRDSSTSWYKSYGTTMDRAKELFQELQRRYGEDQVEILEFQVRVVMVSQDTERVNLVGGMSKTEVEKKLEEIQDRFVVINPNSKTNCCWTSICIAADFETHPNLLEDSKMQNMYGSKLKKTVGTRNEKGGTEEDLQRCCDYKGRTIIVYDGFNTVLGTFIPDQMDPNHTEPIYLLLLNAHYHALVPKHHELVQDYCEQQKNQQANDRDLKPIPKYTKSLEPKRIVAYDLESYKDPQTVVRSDGSNSEEIHQIAYACAWALMIESKEEEEHCTTEGYELHTYTFMGAPVTVAYRRILGEHCLNESIDLWLSDPMYHDAVFYAHNGGTFDIRLILGQSDLMYKEAYVINGDKTIELNGRIINMEIQNLTQEYKETKVTKKGEVEVKYLHTISLRDSIALFGPTCSLAKLCKELKVPHQKLEEHINVHDLQYEDTWLLNWYGYNMDQYLLHDVLGLLEVLTQFNQKVVEGTSIPITAVNTGASLAKKFYLMHYYLRSEEDSKADVCDKVYTLDKPMDQFIRQGYGGGRCEAFISKEMVGKCYYYDFTSLYPDVGRNSMPTGKPKWISDPENPDPRMVQSVWQDRVIQGRTVERDVFWKVRVRSPLAASGHPMDPKFRKPLFGLQEQHMYIFRWYSEWTEMVIYEREILFAIEHRLDYEFEPINGIKFETKAILKDCMEELFKRKAEATARDEEALAKTWKIIINSLYGVWGLKILDREGIEISRPEKSNWAMDLATDKLMDIDKIGRYVVTRRLKDLQVSDCNVAIAAAVTSYARMKLYDLMMDIQNQGGEILYCDTDSIITNFCVEESTLKDKWIGISDGKDLGSLKNEIDKCYDKIRDIPRTNYFDRCVIVAPKLYAIEGGQGKILKKAHKGYKENESKGDLVTYERMKQLIDRSRPAEDRFMVQTTDQWLGGNRDIMKNNIGVRIVERKKRLKQTVNKGILNEDGNIVPFDQVPIL